MNVTRRNFCRVLGAAGLALLLPRAFPRSEPDIDWEHVHTKVMQIAKEQGRNVRRMWIEGGKVRVQLEAGSSLLDKLFFEFNVSEPWEETHG
jgi:hypothetical protein